jgi:hypothetical protein
MSKTLSSLVSTSGVIIGIGLTLSFMTISYLTPYKTLGSSSTDLPYDLATVEMIIGFITLILTILEIIYLTTPKESTNKRFVLNKNVASIAFFATFAIFEGVITVIRLQNLGIIFPTIEGTCSDKNPFTGCPTTRFEEKHQQEIEYTKPTGGDCQFWFWGEMRRRSTPNACESTNSSICNWYIENYMDWSSPESYGMRYDPLRFNTTTLMNEKPTEPTVNNMEELMKIQAQSVPRVLHNKAQPNLAYCWYWGCNPICNSRRYLTNRVWLILSVTLLVLYFTNFILSLIACTRLKRFNAIRERIKKNDSTNNNKVSNANSANVTTDVENGELMIPDTLKISDMGRRKRQLVSNPSILRF